MNAEEKAREATITAIAQKYLMIRTLEEQKSDRLDFHELPVWSLAAALQAAFEAGKAAAK